MFEHDNTHTILRLFLGVAVILFFLLLFLLAIRCRFVRGGLRACRCRGLVF